MATTSPPPDQLPVLLRKQAMLRSEASGILEIFDFYDNTGSDEDFLHCPFCPYHYKGCTLTSQHGGATITQYFEKIFGYKVVSKCRNCGVRLVSRTETRYCEGCLDKLRNWRDKNE